MARRVTGTVAILALDTLALLLLVAIARAEFPYLTDAGLNASCTGPLTPLACCTGAGTGTCTRCDSSSLPAGCVGLANEMSGGAGACNGNKWKYASTNFCSSDATVNASPNELFGVTGMSVEIAWRLETGRPDVVIAVHDSGFMWNDVGATSDLRKKFYLNRGELAVPAPPGGCPMAPLGDPHDCNGDGVFNMEDYDGYALGPFDGNANGLRDPQDLILSSY